MGDTLALCYHAVSDRWPAGFVGARPTGSSGRSTTLLDRGYVGATFREAVIAPPADADLR